MTPERNLPGRDMGIIISQRARTIAALVPSAAALLLAGCGAQTPPPKLATITVPLPENILVTPLPPPLEPVPPELVYASRGEDLWHLRAALNVAALICDPKVHTTMVTGYNRMLTVHKALLTAAVQSEIDQAKAKDGKKWQALFDTHMTKVYNQYSITPQRERFCSKAVEIVNAAADQSAESLSAQATTMIFRLNRAGDIRDAPVSGVVVSAPAKAPAPIPAPGQTAAR